MLVAPRRPPVPLQPCRQRLPDAPCRGCSGSESGGTGCRPRPMVPGGSGLGGSWAKSFPSKQDPYLAAACVDRPRAEGLVPPPRGLARLQRGGTRVLPAERCGCPAAGRAHAAQLCPQPSVRLSRNGGSLHGWGITSRAVVPPAVAKPREVRGCGGHIRRPGLPAHPEGNGASGCFVCSPLTS